MKKPARLRLLLSRMVVAFILLFSSLAWAEVASAKAPEVRTNDSMGIADPHLKADMLRILDSLRNSPDGDRMALDHLKERFTQENVQLGLAETEKAIMTVQRYMPSDKEGRSVDTAGLLIALGETNAITKAVQSMLTGQPSEAKRARLALARSGQAKVIPELVDLLFRDENVAERMSLLPVNQSMQRTSSWTFSASRLRSRPQ
jgi:hypothetical protein